MRVAEIERTAAILSDAFYFRKKVSNVARAVFLRVQSFRYLGIFCRS
jgi:hypothetical protein